MWWVTLKYPEHIKKKPGHIKKKSCHFKKKPDHIKKKPLHFNIKDKQKLIHFRRYLAPIFEFQSLLLTINMVFMKGKVPPLMARPLKPYPPPPRA